MGCDMKKRFRKGNNRIRVIIRQQNGATIVFALVVFMIAAIISATIVNVALTNLKRVTSRKSNEQARLAVMSAAKCLEAGEADVSAALDNLKADDIGEIWTVGTTNADVNQALETSIKWDEIHDGSSLTATIQSGDYSVKARFSRDMVTGKWSITKLTKE